MHFYLPDVPTIISGSKVAYLEPQEELWKGESGRSYQLSEVAGTEHLTPFYGIAGFSPMIASYNQTLFRFPLRNAVSKLSKNIYSIEKVKELINALKSEAKLLLLFLRSITTIEIYNINVHGQQTLSFQVKVSYAFMDELTRKRRSLLDDLRRIHIKCQYNFSNIIKFTAKFDVSVYDASTRQTLTSHWLVANQVGSSNSTVREASVKQKVFPWVGTALELDNPGSGRIFCFLPMPIEAASDLPVHVNGTFGLTDDRRSLKWPGVERRNDPTADWNKLLVKEVIPSCYVDLLLEAKNHLSMHDSSIFYKAWPDVIRLRGSHWEDVLTSLFQTLLRNSVIWSAPLRQSGEWVLPTNAVYVPKSQRLISIVERTLTSCGVKLADVPTCVWDAFSHVRTSVTSVSPKLVRDKLRTYPNSYTSIDAVGKCELLKYCLSDGISNYNELANLKLLPLANGTFAAFLTSSYFFSPPIYLCTPECPRYLLPNLDSKLVDVSSDPTLQHLLTQVANSNHTQLKLLNVATVASLLDEAMPSQWSSRMEVVSFTSSQFPVDWFKKFWDWVQNKNLGSFQGKFIVPIEVPGYHPIAKFNVAKLSNQNLLYFSSHVSLSNEMITILNKFSILYVKQSSFPYLIHRQISQYLTPFTPESLLQAISKNSYYNSVSLTPQEATTLKTQFYNMPGIRNYQHIIMNLKMFTTSSNTSGRLCSVSEASSQSILKTALSEPSNPVVDISVFPPSLVLLSSSDYYQNELLRKLFIQAQNDVNFLTGYIFPYIQNGTITGDDVDKIMTRVLDAYQSLQFKNYGITNYIQQLRFVKIASGLRKCPNELYDPNDVTSQIYLGEDVFPRAPYDKYLNILRSCGMKTSVSPQEVLDVIYSISTGSSSHPQQVNSTKLNRAKAILKYIGNRSFTSQTSGSFTLNRSIHRGYLPFNTAVQLLSCNRSWLPVLSKRPRNYPSSLPWRGDGCTSHFIALNGSACVSCSSSPSLPLLYGSQVYFIAPDVDGVDANVSALLGSEEPTTHLVPHFTQVIAYMNSISSDQMISIVHNIYSKMLQLVNQGSKGQLNGLRSMNDWIYIKKYGRFVGVNAIALQQNPGFRHSVEPYLHILPDSISSFSTLFTSFGMNRTLSDTQIISILSVIKKEITSNPSSVNPGEAWSTVMAILNWLTNNGTEETSHDSILVPAESESRYPDLRQASELIYTDNDVFKDLDFAMSSIDSDKPQFFVHDRISSSLAKCLQIRPLSEEFDIAEDTIGDAGQQEPLIVRLKNILRDYKDGLTIVKELIQNADDAEATEINICFDARTHDINRKKLFFPDMVESHGPALVVHNNTTFSDEDFDNIQKLAGATKQEKHLKIGKFGIGFCSVYHITDVPSFISRDRLYIFDPTLKHLSTAVKNRAQPGQRVKYLSRIIKKSQQLQPYAGLFGFDCNSQYGGTIFRLPFRTSVSELSSTCYSQAAIWELIQSIQQCGDKLLLFLQHIKRITVQKIETGQTKPTLLYKICKTTPQFPITLNCASVICVESTRVRERKRSSNNWLVSKHESLYGRKSGIAHVACMLNTIGGGRSSYNADTDIQGEIFCFLPLSQTTGLPVHVSCNFAVINNRRGIWTSDESTSRSGTEVLWNIFLMTKLIPQAYVGLLSNLQRLHENNMLQNYIFYSLWPLKSELQQKDPWEHCLNAFYKILASQKLFHSESIKKWLTVQQSKFLESNILCQSGTPSCVFDVVHQLSLPIVDLPSSYRSQLNLKGLTITEEVFTRLFFDNLPILACIKSSRNEVVCYMLEIYVSQRDRQSTISRLLKQYFDSHACIPCGKAGDVLRKCTEVIHPSASFASLFDESENRFPLGVLVTRHLASTAMQCLGMMYQSISWTLVLERARTVATLIEVDRLKALNRVKLILETISDPTRMSGNPSSGSATIDKIPFLPVMKKLNEYPLQWYGDKHQLLCGNQLMLSGAFSYIPDLTNMRIAGSQVAFINEALPKDGGCGFIKGGMRGLLHLRSSPTCDEVIAHLKMVIDSSSTIDSQWINYTCSEIYAFIESALIKSGDSGLNLHGLECIPCIWNGQKFLSFDTVALDWKLKEGPYLYVVPPSIASKQKLLSTLKVKKEFSHHDAQKALGKMKADFRDKPVTESCKNLIIELIPIFQKVESPQEKFRGFSVYLPNRKLVLQKAIDLAYNDAPWAASDDEYDYVHEMFPRNLAEELGVRLVRSRMLDQFVSKKDTYFEGVEFGQHEKLTRRIQNIIRDYPFDITILKELLQNADDAKAKKMYFVLDKRTHGTNSVISRGWCELQGPALLVWNDSTFTEKDLKGIQELGLGSKRSDAETIGQYGIGFNVVYHLTDCPSLITGGETLCIMDPHCKYIKEADQLHPGRRYDDLHKGFWKKFPDMSSAYLQTGLDDVPPEILNGSLFRFPIRHSLDMIKSSRIVDHQDRKSSQPLTAKDLYDLMHKWMPQMKQAMFFLNNVKEIKFMVIEEEGIKLDTKFHFKTEIPQSAAFKDESQKFHETLSAFKNEKNCKTLVIRYPLTVTDINCQEDGGKDVQEKWLVQQGVGDINNESQMWQYVRTVKPRHGIAAPLSLPRSTTSGIAAPLSLLPSNTEGQLFCFLPLPVKSDLPVHVNGHFILDSNRRNLWKSTDPDVPDDRSRWNANLFKAIASSYANFLANAKDYYIDSKYKGWTLALNALHNYYKLFPRFSVVSVAKQWDKLNCIVHKILLKENAQILCVFESDGSTSSGQKIIATWHPLIAPAQSDQVYLWTHEMTSAKRKVIHPILSSIGMKLTSAPPRVMECFNAVISKPEQECVTRSSDQKEVALASTKLQQKCATPSNPQEVALTTCTRRKIPSLSPQSAFDYYTKHSSFASSGTMEPCQISETIFHDTETFLVFIKYLLKIEIVENKNETSKPGARETVSATPEPPKTFPEEPFSHFLLLSADGVLRKFDAESKILNSHFSHLFSHQHLDKFLHPELRTLHFHPSYFIHPEDTDKDRILKVFLNIFDDTFHQKLKSQNCVTNYSPMIRKDALKKYWTCFYLDGVFSEYLNMFLKNWALLLTVDDRLFSLSSEVVPMYLPETPDYTIQNMCIVMQKLKMPFLDASVVRAQVDCPKLNEQDRILNNVSQVNNSTPLISTLKIQEIDMMIHYFSQSPKHLDEKWLTLIQSLPFFEDVLGQYQPIIGREAFIWPQDASAAGYKSWSKGSNSIFIKNYAKWQELGSHQQLSLKTISKELLYVKFIFPNFCELDEDERYKHLEHIRDTVYSTCKHYKDLDARYQSKSTLKLIREARQFIGSLTDLKCIGSESSCLQPVSAFCDHTIEIFKVFSCDFQKLPEQLQSEKWLTFFKELGLKVILTTTEYLNICNKTAQRKVNADISKYSAALIKYIFTKEITEKWYHDCSFLSQVSNIAFACTENLSCLEWIHPGAHQEAALVSLNGAASDELKNLLWTVRPIIKLPWICTYYPDKKTKSLLSNLKIVVKASIDDIIPNIRNISTKSPYANEALFGNYPSDLTPPSGVLTNLMLVMLDNLIFLNDDLSNVPISALAKLSCIPVHSDLFEKDSKQVVLVKPSCVLRYNSDAERYHPFLHKIPEELLRVSNLMEKLEIKHQVGLHHLQIVLEKVFISSQGLRLDPNTKQSVIKAMEDLKNLLPRKGQGDKSSGILSPLYLPDTEGRLKLSTDLLYGDTYNYFGHMKLTLTDTQYSHFDITEEMYGVDASELCHLLPEQVRPLGMSLVCKQVLDEDSDIVEDSELAIRLGKSIQHESQPLAIVKVAKKHNIADTNDGDLKSTVSTFLSSLRIITVRNLKTDIKLIDSDTLIGNITSDFVLGVDENEPYLYLDYDCDDPEEVTLHIAQHICKTLFQQEKSSDSIEKFIRFISLYMKAESPKQRERLLSKYSLSIKSRSADEFTAKLGEEIPKCFHSRLDRDLYNVFRPMEYVGYEKTEGNIIVAQILHPAVQEEVDHRLHKRFKISTSQDDMDGRDVSILDLYKFLIGRRKERVTPLVPEGDRAALVPYDADNDLINLRRAMYEGNLVDILASICKELKEVWELTPELRRKAVRRLYLKWHPDKNLDDPAKAKKVFLFLTQQIEHLDNGEPLDDPSEEMKKTEMERPSTPPPASSRSKMQSDFDRWNRTASDINEAYINEQTRADSNKDSSPFDKIIDQRNPEEGGRWMKQAAVDYEVLTGMYVLHVAILLSQTMMFRDPLSLM